MLQNKNFIVLLSDQSPGAKIGQKSAAVVNITNGKLIRAVLTATPKHPYVALCCPMFLVNVCAKDKHFFT